MEKVKKQELESLFVEYKQALALKELGFNEPCFGYYIETKEWIPASYSQKGTIYPSNSDLMKEWVSASLYQQAFRWFREKYGHYSEIRVGCTQIDGSIGYAWWVWKPWSFEEWSPEVPGEEWSYYDYEEAEKACLDKLIEICKKN